MMFFSSRVPGRPRNRVAGFSLVELMIAMAISLLLLAGVIRIYVDSKRNYTVQESLSRLQESGRYAVTLLTQDLRLSGYYGTGSDPSRFTGTQAPVAAERVCSSDNRWGRMLEQVIFGVNDAVNDGLSDYSACISTSSGTPATGDYIQGDIVVVRHVVPTAVAAYEPNRLYLRTTFQDGKLFAGSEESGNTLSDDPAFTRALAANAYFVGYQSTECAGNTIILPTLYREALGNNGRPVREELVRGVEQLEFQYGVDTNGDGSVNRYMNADQVTLNSYWPSVASVRLWLLVRTDCPVTGYNNGTPYRMGDVTYTPNDSFRRQLYTTTIALRN